MDKDPRAKETFTTSKQYRTLLHGGRRVFLITLNLIVAVYDILSSFLINYLIPTINLQKNL